MSAESTWSSLEVAKLFTSILTPLTVVALGFWFDKSLKKFELATTKESKNRELEIYEKRQEIERRYKPHVEFTINCQFLGLKYDDFLVNFIIIANNRGYVVQRFKSIRLRVRGIKKDEQFKYWKGHEKRVEFPHKILETEVKPDDWEFIFVEPSVSQQITFTTLIPSVYSFLLAKVEFSYDQFTPHNAEGVFAVPENAMS